MKLADLEPRWIHQNIFIFKCPCCRKVWLTAKNKAMTRQESWDALKAGLGEDWNETVVPPSPEFAWSIKSKDVLIDGKLIPTEVTVTPSIDASASGHWHGFITNGIIT